MPNSLPMITIQTPCTVPWDTMRGDDRVRFCGQCERQVFDLGNLSSSEVMELLGGTEEVPCVRFYRRPDGRVMTADCPLSIRERTWKWLHRRAAWAASLFASLCLPACGAIHRSMMFQGAIDTHERAKWIPDDKPVEVAPMARPIGVEAK